MQTITIEQLEQLAAQIAADEESERQRLLRLIRAYARILAKREPDKFPRRATERSDEDGHFDNSFPPSITFKDRTGARLFKVRGWSYEDVATEGGFYYAWRRVTTDPGLYVARDGALFGADETGTGRVGQFAAYPGDCNVMCRIRWDERDESDIPLDELQEAERALRVAAFPLTQH